jgi:hypothetical protein
VQQDARHRRRNRSKTDPEDEPPRLALAADRVHRNGQQPAEIDHRDRKDGAQLDQHLEGAPGTVELEEMPDQKEVGGRRNRNEFGEAFDDAENQRHKKTLIHVHSIPYFGGRAVLRPIWPPVTSVPQREVLLPSCRG